jgi:hypothetical protein
MPNTANDFTARSDQEKEDRYSHEQRFCALLA